MKKKSAVTVTSPLITPEEGIRRMEELIERAERLLAKPANGGESSAYYMALKSALLDAFGEGSPFVGSVMAAGTPTSIASWEDETTLWHDELEAKKTVLSECISELRRRASRSTTSVPKGEGTPVLSPRQVVAAKNFVRRQVLKAAVELSARESPTAIVLLTEDDFASTGLETRQIAEALQYLADEGLLKLKGLNPELYQLMPRGKSQYEKYGSLGLYVG